MKVEKEDFQRLSQRQEKHLADWLLNQAALGHRKTHQRLREFAGLVLQAGNDHQPFGKNRFTGFLARSPKVKKQSQVD